MPDATCGACKRSFQLAQAKTEALTGVDEVLCVKHGLDPSKMMRVTCPFCGGVSLRPVGLARTGSQGATAQEADAFVCASCKRQWQASVPQSEARTECSECGGVALRKGLANLLHVRKTAELAGRVSRLRARAFDRTGPLYNAQRRDIYSGWLQNIRHNLEAAIDGFTLRVDARGQPITDDKVFAGLRRMCQELAKPEGLQRVEDVCSAEVAREVRAIFAEILKIEKSQGAPSSDPMPGARVAPLAEDMIRLALRRHLEKLAREKSSEPGFGSVAPLLKGLVAGAKLTFATEAVAELWPEAASGSTLRSTGREFDDCYVGVDVLPTVEAVRWPAMFRPAGYLEHLNRFEPARILRGQALAAWCFCSDGTQAVVHLTFMGPGGVMNIMAQDLMTPLERKEVGLP